MNKMKIFFLASRNKEHYNTYNKIINSLEKNGHQVFSEWMKSTDQDDSVNFEQAYKRNINWIKLSDIVVSDISQPTSGVSFLIASALNEKKPVLALYNSEDKSIPPSTIRGSSKTNKLLSYVEYKNSNLEQLLVKYTEEIKSQLDTKFILIISPEIDRYLQWASENRRMHKAQVVRIALEEVMEKDKEYQKHLKNVE